jgi:hypothetical protein
MVRPSVRNAWHEAQSDGNGDSEESKMLVHDHGDSQSGGGGAPSTSKQGVTITKNLLPTDANNGLRNVPQLSGQG